jgi:hypothetical protein
VARWGMAAAFFANGASFLAVMRGKLLKEEGSED